MTRILKERKFSGTTDPKVQPWELEHRKVARRAAAEGIVLLKNEDHILPLKAGSKVALYGAGAGRTIKGGTGSGDVNERERVSVFQGMKNAGFQVTTEAWIESYDQIYENARQEWKRSILSKTGEGADTMDFFTVYSTTPFKMPAGDPIQKPAEGEDTENAIYVLSRIAGEGSDRTADKGDYDLSEEEHQMLADICAYYKNVVVVINAGAQVDLSFMDEFRNIRALLVIVQPGMEGGNAFADILSGKVNPSGKLADTWAYKYEDYPSSEKFSHNNGNVETELYDEGIYVGYRYFDTFEVPVRYGFGYGLSYTDFEITGCALKAVSAEKIRVTATVRNTGNVSGKEVVQVYASLPGGILEKEAHRLAAYAKTNELKPGEAQEVTMEVKMDGLTSYDEKRAAWILESGFYGIWVGNSLASAKLCGGIKLDQEVIRRQVRNLFPLKQELEEISQEASKTAKRAAAAAQQAKEEELTVLNIRGADIATETVEYKKNADLYEKEAMDFVNTLSEEDLIDLAAGDPGKAQGGNLGAAGISVPGSAGETHRCAVDKGLASIVLADGPAGLRLMKYYHVNDGSIVSMPFEFSLEGGLFYDDSRELPGERYYQYCTAIPVGTLLAQTWNRELIREVGAMIGTEMEHFGVTLWLAPGMNIHRNPLCGRNFEYYSEDPYLSGVMAVAACEGAYENGVYPYLKHFAFNEQETNRNAMLCTWLSEQSARELYLKPFEDCVKSNDGEALAMMSCFNYIGNEWGGGYAPLLNDILRGEWGFRGMVLSDYFGDYGYMDADRAIRGGTDCMLGTTGGRAVVDDESATSVLAMRQASKNIMYTVVNSVAYEDYSGQELPRWVKMTYGIDAGLAVIFILAEVLLIRRYRKRSKMDVIIKVE